MTRQELYDYLIEEADYTQEELNEMCGQQLVAAWCYWNFGYDWSDDICSVIEGAFKIDLSTRQKTEDDYEVNPCCVNKEEIRYDEWDVDNIDDDTLAEICDEIHDEIVNSCYCRDIFHDAVRKVCTKYGIKKLEE